MASSEKVGCMFRSLFFAHSSEVCEVAKCMICNDGRWEQAVVEIFPPVVLEMPLDAEKDSAGYEETCDLDGYLLDSGSLICEKGACGVCFEGKWLLPDELE